MATNYISTYDPSLTDTQLRASPVKIKQSQEAVTWSLYRCAIELRVISQLLQQGLNIKDSISLAREDVIDELHTESGY